MAAFQHLFGAQMPFKKLQLVVGQAQSARAVGLDFFGRIIALCAAVKVAEAVLHQVGRRSAVGRRYVVQLAGVAQGQIVAHDGF